MTDIGRCGWAKGPLYLHYHDTEWGVPIRHDDRALFERLCLEGAQSGLSWITILRKRDHYRLVFDQFDPEEVARYDEAKIIRLLADPGIVRNRAKIEAAIANARAYLDLRDRVGSFSDFLWGFVDGRTIINRCADHRQCPTETPQSRAMSRALKANGFRFCGPTICYALMQAVGMVNDHEITCFRHAACAALAVTR
ncbi:MAG: DNA-3-methyladenine glycosylase I [Candidatus Flexifilum sp.]